MTKRTFLTDFNDNCVTGLCEGWSVEGEYFVETSRSGSHTLDMLLNFKGPHMMDEVSKATFFISNTPKG